MHTVPFNATCMQLASGHWSSDKHTILVHPYQLSLRVLTADDKCRLFL